MIFTLESEWVEKRLLKGVSQYEVGTFYLCIQLEYVILIKGLW